MKLALVFFTGLALVGFFSGLGEGPPYQAPFMLAAGFGTVVFLLSLRLNERATKAKPPIAPKILLFDRIKTVYRS